MVNWFRSLFESRKNVEILYKVEIRITEPIVIRIDGQTATQVQIQPNSGGSQTPSGRYKQDDQSSNIDKFPVELRIDLPLPEAEFGQEVK